MQKETTAIPQFGDLIEGIEYVERPGAYVVLLNPFGRVAVIEVDEAYHLPGGGIEEGESVLEAARRETLEEIGIEALINKEIGRANQFVYSAAASKYLNKLCVYFFGRIKEKCSRNRDCQHKVIWMLPPEACKRLAHESHVWAVKRVVGDSGINRPGAFSTPAHEANLIDFWDK